jgi:hypothetical protein
MQAETTPDAKSGGSFNASSSAAHPKDTVHSTDLRAVFSRLPGYCMMKVMHQHALLDVVGGAKSWLSSCARRTGHLSHLIAVQRAA